MYVCVWFNDQILKMGICVFYNIFQDNLWYL